ncbi:hypothetical protein K505DRAFT_282035 [Melanomma pulvis-pyrius CBS 109.77]|uniref:EamA domain-containing protein n=1 Tax=Melanomma pulvis-pyrius CBS 109.77 TaxID=1314802 RepID=A0A6A6X319_9PLEO|nr:hypothetical protein K505DRAFT_282035 [Melanomma pulvis-pyrius CBS 109.77]
MIAAIRGACFGDFVQRHGGIILMLAAQACSTILSTIGRILRTGHGTDNREIIGTSEILLFMMITTTVFSWIYIYLTQIPSFCFVDRKVLPLLFLRGIAGFFGIWGFYYSLRDLALAEATIINFIAPMLAILLSGLLLGQHYTAAQIFAGLISIVGVMCVFQPWSAYTMGVSTGHSLAVGAAFVGVLGGAISYITISRLGEAVHPIVTVAYFATITTMLNGLVLLFQMTTFRIPSTSTQWLAVCVLGTLSFAMHWLSTASLTWDANPNQALNIVYVQIVFAILADKLVFKISPDVWKYVGGGLILGSAAFVAGMRSRHDYARLEMGNEENEELEMGIELDEMTWKGEHVD